MSPQEFNEIFLIATNSKFRTKWAHGYCYMYAYCFLSVLGGTAVTWMPKNKNKGGHVFIKYNDLFFDAESFAGQSSWKRLQKYLNKSNDRLIVRHRTLTGVTSYWFKGNKKDLLECQEIVNKINNLITI